MCLCSLAGTRILVCKDDSQVGDQWLSPPESRTKGTLSRTDTHPPSPGRRVSGTLRRASVTDSIVVAQRLSPHREIITQVVGAVSYRPHIRCCVSWIDPGRIDGRRIRRIDRINSLRTITIVCVIHPVPPSHPHSPVGKRELYVRSTIGILAVEVDRKLKTEVLN